MMDLISINKYIKVVKENNLSQYKILLNILPYIEKINEYNIEFREIRDPRYYNSDDAFIGIFLLNNKLNKMCFIGYDKVNCKKIIQFFVGLDLELTQHIDLENIIQLEKIKEFFLC